jgi:coenzyme F420 hydrogenase subunit beta
MSGSEPPASLCSLGRIVADGACHRCGSCAGVCPAGVIEPDDDYFPDWRPRLARCTDCGLCVKVCPGAAFSYPAFSAACFGREAALVEDHGHFLQAFLGYTTDPEMRRVSASGGLGTRLPQFLLETGRVTAALSVGADPARPWRSLPFWARTAADLRAGMVSKYTVCSLNHLLREVRHEPGQVLFTGLPCHVHGLLKMGEINSALERKVFLRIGLLCHSALDPAGMRDMLAHYRIDERQLARLVYRHGKLPGFWRAEMRDGREIFLPYPRAGARGYRPTSKECLTFLFKLYSPRRCRMCIDGFAEFADISIGDPYLKGWQGMGRLSQGYNLVFARSERGLAVLEEASRAGAIVLEPLSREQALASELPMIRAKRARAFFTIGRQRAAGRIGPDYGLHRSFTAGERAGAALHCAQYYPADHVWLRRLLNPLLLSPAGRLLVAALFFRRRVVEAALAKIKARRQA